MIAEGDTVVARWTLTGTQTGPFLGIAPTGRTIRIGGMSMDHLENGILVSGFDGWDNLGLRQQLGVIPEDHESVNESRHHHHCARAAASEPGDEF